MSRRAELKEVLARIEARVAEIEATPEQERRRQDRGELELRRAVLRLAHGNPVRTDGAMTAVALAEESGVPRPTMYRTYRDVIEDWDAVCAVAEPDSDAGLRERVKKLNVEVKRLERELVELRRKSSHVRNVLVQRVQALTLSLLEARGGSKLTTIGTLREAQARARGRDDGQA